MPLTSRCLSGGKRHVQLAQASQSSWGSEHTPGFVNQGMVRLRGESSCSSPLPCPGLGRVTAR